MPPLFGKKEEKKEMSWDEEALEKKEISKEYGEQFETEEVKVYDDDTCLKYIIQIAEEVKATQDHDVNINEFDFKGNLTIKNPSEKNRLWDIEVFLDNIEATNLETDRVSVRELGTEESNNQYSKEFELTTEESKSQLLIKEYINSSLNADEVLNLKALERDLNELRQQDISVEERDDILESLGIAIDQNNEIFFAIGVKNISQRVIKNIEIQKELPEEFENVSNLTFSTGKGEYTEDGYINWSIDEIEQEKTEILKVSVTISVDSIDERKTGPLSVNYLTATSFTGGLNVKNHSAYTHNSHFIDIIERDEEPENWDCQFTFQNPTEFCVEILDIDIHDLEDPDTNFIMIDPDSTPKFGANAKWLSDPWYYESSDYPLFQKNVEFRVLPEVETVVSGSLEISDVHLFVSSIIGDVVYSRKEKVTERTPEDIRVPTYKESQVVCSLKIENNGSAPLNEIGLIHQFFTEEFIAPPPDDIRFELNGEEVELYDAVNISVNKGSLNITITDLRYTNIGLFNPDDTLMVYYPIQILNPPQGARFESEVIYSANTFPQITPLELKPEVPVIEAIHIRRSIRLSKEIIPLSAFGDYEIILTAQNNSNIILEELELRDAIPEQFKYKTSSQEPKSIEGNAYTIIKWDIEQLEQEELKEITYEVTGSGGYAPKEIMLTKNYPMIIQSGKQLKDYIPPPEKEAEKEEEDETEKEEEDETEKEEEEKGWKDFTEEEKEEYRRQKEQEKEQLQDEFKEFLEVQTLKDVVLSVDEVSDLEDIKDEVLDLDERIEQLEEKDPEKAEKLKDIKQRHGYSVRNYLMVLSQSRNRNETDFQGIINSYINWKRMGAQVLKNPDKSKPYGYKIFVPVFKTDANEELKGYKMGTVFDISQTNKYEPFLEQKEEVRELAEDMEEIEYERAREFIDDNFSEISIDEDITGEKGGYEREDKMVLLHQKTSHDLFHQIGTHILHENNIFYTDKNADEKNEILSEIACYLLMKKFEDGQKYKINYDFGYSNVWATELLEYFKFTEFEKAYNELVDYIKTLSI